LPPIRPSFLKSASDATPVIRDARTSGTAINFRRLMKIVPKGAIQSEVNEPQPRTAATTPKATPRIRPIMICQWSFLCQDNVLWIIV